MTSLRIAFAGTPQFARARPARAARLRARVVGVLTQPDRPAGRGRQLRACARQTSCAAEHGLPIAQPPTLKTPEGARRARAMGARICSWSSPTG